MRVGTRIVFSLFIVVILVICAAIIVSALGLVDASHARFLTNGFLYSDYKYIWAGAAALIFVVGVTLLFFGTGKHEPDTVVLAETADGSVQLTIAAVEELAGRYLSGVSGVLVQRIRISAVAVAAVKLKLELSVKPGVEIPAVMEQIKGGVTEYMEKFAGLMANSVEIRIVPVKNAASK